jgi:ribosomal protein L11 methyltransferase
MRTWPALEILFSDPADLLAAALLDFNVSAIHETSTHVWCVFFPTAADRDAAAEGIAAGFLDVSVRSLDVADEDWAARSQAGLRAVRIGHIVVAPPWDVPDGVRLKGPDDADRQVVSGHRGTRPAAPVVVVIQPSTGFGTGHHATTRLCLAALQQIDLAGRRVLDVGTGSGVLAIAASRLGAASVLGIDEDPDALHAARESVALNPGADVALEAADVRSMASRTFDVVAANLTGALLTQVAGRLRLLAAPGGSLILSGFLKSEEAAVRAAYEGLPSGGRAEEDGWVCVTLERP